MGTTSDGFVDAFAGLQIQETTDTRGRESVRSTVPKALEHRSGTPEAMQIQDLPGNSELADRAVQNQNNQSTQSQACTPSTAETPSLNAHAVDQTADSRSGIEEENLILPGHYLVLAKVWPGKLASGLIGLPDALQAAFGGDHALGRTTLIYRVGLPGPHIYLKYRS